MRWPELLVAFVLGFLLSYIAHTAAARAQSFTLPHSQAQHDMYGGIRNRDGQVCCNRQDCKRIVKEQEVNILPEGGYIVRANNEFVKEGKVADSPDGEWHICRDYVYSAGGYTPTGPVRCLMMPFGGS